MLIILLSLLCCTSAKLVHSQWGRVCAFGDFNNDRYTDIIAQQGSKLRILLQEDKLLNVLEEGVFKNSSWFEVGNETVDCVLGDFNGDSRLDVLVSVKDGNREKYRHSLWIASGSNDEAKGFVETPLGDFSGPAMAADVDGDGIHDVIGFSLDGHLYCQTFKDKSYPCAHLFSNYTPIKAYPGMPHLYMDVMGNDLLSEFVFMTEDDRGRLAMQVWGRDGDKWRKTLPQIAALTEHKYVAAVVPADFDADGIIELLVPVCKTELCEEVTTFVIWQNNRGWNNYPVDFGDLIISSDKNSKVLFHVGDFTLDGFPDLVATMGPRSNGNGTYPRIIDNTACPNCEKNGTRKFEMRAKQMFVQQREMALAVKTMSTFFDLKEDGSLDILVEYIWNDQTRFSFFVCDDKGDTTFLKVQVFTSVCDKQCNPISTELGSGISYGGTCMSFSMSDGWGGSLQSMACQVPALTHRSLMAPYVLFGLGRSPNFVDELAVGIPRNADKLNDATRMHTLKQIVPNSRLIMIPPAPGGTHWQNRLYVTPSQLILQSLMVIAFVCTMLLIVVAFLHYREKKEDRVERQQQSHRFHFDAM